MIDGETSGSAERRVHENNVVLVDDVVVLESLILELSSDTAALNLKTTEEAH